MKHYIIVKYKEEVTPQQKQQLLPEITELFNNLYQIEGVGKVEVCPNVVDRENRFDLMIEIEMADEETLKVYDDCKWHHLWKQQYGHLIASKTIFDRG